ncbi:MAG: CxxxxCH/CxxCH domain-containing protein [Deltaproteobacteria bacterium]|nr:CxxxxCH/CxxCH domain-containing protein [Deltaproteobacteria bacterium]
MQSRFAASLVIGLLVVGCSGGGSEETPVYDAEGDAAVDETETGASDSGGADESSAETASDSDAEDVATSDTVDDGADEAGADAVDVGDDVETDGDAVGTGDVAVEGGDGGSFPAACSWCHGDRASGNPAPPRSATGETATSARGVGAHAKHLSASAWRHEIVCTDCHAVPTDLMHGDGKADLKWSARAGAITYASLTCRGSTCHGAKLLPPPTSVAVAREPVWNVVDGTYSKCGTSCHSNPPAGWHTPATACDGCHADVVDSYDPVTMATTWKDASRHVNGVVDVVGGKTCTSCHGDATTKNPAPPRGSKGETLTTDRAVGAHAKHLGASTWRRDIACDDCHPIPSWTLHSNAKTDLLWGTLTRSDGAAPKFDPLTSTCAGQYCHGATLLPASAGGTTRREPVFNQVDGTFSACGESCHTNPPGGTHPNSTACPTCHGTVIATYDPTTKAATWKDRSKHIDGEVVLNCTSCHGVPGGSEAPPNGTKGETLTSQKAVGAHQAHLASSTWHRDVLCADCHTKPTSVLHMNGVAELTWSAVSAADGAAPAYGATTATCSGVYCHGSTLAAAAPGGTTRRQPVWTTVDGTYDGCGTSCHTNPPGGWHSSSMKCPTCHTSIKTYDPVTKTATWKDRTLHVNGKVDAYDMGDCMLCHEDMF